MTKIAGAHVLDLSNAFFSSLYAQDDFLNDSSLQLKILDLSRQDGACLLRSQSFDQLHELNSTLMSLTKLTYDEWGYRIGPNIDRGLSKEVLKTPR
jgi:hypothetical protein